MEKTVYMKSPIQTKKKCANPFFADKHTHRVGAYLGEHLGNKEDIDPHGLKGYLVNIACVQCGMPFGREFITDATFKELN